MADLSDVEMFRKGMRKVVIRARGTSPAEGSPFQAAGVATPRQQYEMLSTEVAKLEDLSTTSRAKVRGDAKLHCAGGEESAHIRKPRKRSKSGDAAVARKSREGRKVTRGEKGSSRRKPRRKSRKHAAEEVSSQVSSCPAGAPAPPVLHFKNASSEEALQAEGERSPPSSASLGTNARSVMGLPNTSAVGREQFRATQDQDDEILAYWTAEPTATVPQNPGTEYTSQGIKTPAIGDRPEKSPGGSRSKAPKEGFQSPVLNCKLKEMTSAIRDMLISHQAAELGSEPRPARTSELKCDASAQTPPRGKQLAGHQPHPASSEEFPEVEDVCGVDGSTGAEAAPVDTFGTPFVFQNPMAAGGTFSHATATPSRSGGSLESSDADLDAGPDVKYTKNPMADMFSPASESPDGGGAEGEETGGPASPLRSQSTSRKLSSRSPVHLEPRVQRLELPPMTGSIHDFIAQMEATLTVGTPSAAHPRAMTTSTAARLPNRSPDSQEPLEKTPAESSSPSRSSMSAFEGGIGGVSLASQATTKSHSTDQNVEEMGAYFELSDVSQALLSSAHRSGPDSTVRVETPDVTPQKFSDWNAVLSRFGTGNAIQANHSHREPEEVPQGSGGLPLDQFLSMAEESSPKNTGEAKLQSGDSVPMEVYLETLSTQVESLILEVKSELKSKRESPAKTLSPGESGATSSRKFCATPAVRKGEESLSDIVDSELPSDGLTQSVHEYSAVVNSYVTAVGERQTCTLVRSPLVSNVTRARTRQALEILFNRITGAEGSNALLPLLEETADLVKSCQEEINVAMGRLEALCRLSHIDNTDETEVQSQVDHLRTKQSSLRQMYEIILLKLNEGEDVGTGFGSPSETRAGSEEGFGRLCDSDSVASAELDAAACAVEILQQRETVNELLLRFT